MIQNQMIHEWVSKKISLGNFNVMTSLKLKIQCFLFLFFAINNYK